MPTIVKERKLKWYGHITKRTSVNTIVHRTVEGARRPGPPKKSWLQNIKEWTDQSYGIA